MRKPGKLPADVHEAAYELEYGTDRLQVHIDGVAPGERVLWFDDLLATGGTAAAVAEIVAEAKAELVAFAFAIELEALGGRAALAGFDAPVVSVIRFAS